MLCSIPINLPNLFDSGYAYFIFSHNYTDSILLLCARFLHGVLQKNAVQTAIATFAPISTIFLRKSAILAHRSSRMLQDTSSLA